MCYIERVGTTATRVKMECAGGVYTITVYGVFERVGRGTEGRGKRGEPLGAGEMGKEAGGRRVSVEQLSDASVENRRAAV